MFDFSTVTDKTIAEKVFAEAKDFMGHCHFGTQGVHRTEADVIAAAERVKKRGMTPLAFDIEMPFVPLAKELMKEWPAPSHIHCAVAYPTGRSTTETKMKVLDAIRAIGADDTCVCIDWEAIFSGRYGDIEKEARQIVDEYLKDFFRVALVIPATLMSDTQIIETCKALDAAGVVSVKVNPGAKLGVSFEEVGLIKRKFINRFDIHPSGNIRTLADVLRYREMGCDNIHTISSMDITEDYIQMKLKEYGVAV